MRTMRKASRKPRSYVVEVRPTQRLPKGTTLAFEHVRFGIAADKDLVARCDYCHAQMWLDIVLANTEGSEARDILNAWTYDHEHGRCTR